MGLPKREEEAVLDFYYWEYRYRGWSLFDYPVDIEVPFVPFPSRSRYQTPKRDDGVSLSLIQQMKSWVKGEGRNEEEKTIPYDYPPKAAYNRNQVVWVLSLGRSYQCDVLVWREVIDTLALCRYSVSFEIIATHTDIEVQFVCSSSDSKRVEAHLKAYFPDMGLREGAQWELPYDPDGTDIAIVDFGLEQESMLPLQIPSSFRSDPLLSLITLFEHLEHGECGVFQIIFRATDNPLSAHFQYAVSDGTGGSFFPGTSIQEACHAKTRSSLLSVCIRLSFQAPDVTKARYLTEQGIIAIRKGTESEHNRLIALSNHGYEYNRHVMNTFYRASYRHGMILSVHELVTLLHYPDTTVSSQKLFGNVRTTKEVPAIATNRKYVLGTNRHNGRECPVSIGDEQKLKHTHVLGATGTGKSTLLANMVLDDVKSGNGLALFDPHGDIVEDVLVRITESRKEDVILIDPSDTDYAIGFNLLQAKTDAEKLVVSSDLVAAFRDTSTSWGDTMNAVLHNVVDTFLDSSEHGTLIELRRFLIEDNFRKQFLQNVSDPQLLYYWKHEYAMVKKRISPLLTRLDTFLRPKVIRSMLVQKKGLDIRKALDEKKIILFKLSLGFIGEQNASLLGSLFLAKLNQSALGRQSLPKSKRHPFYIYLDECQHFMSPSIRAMLSGVRKYGVGLILAHQYLGQLTNPASLDALLSNPYTKIYFRLSGADAKRLEYDLSGFEVSDILSLARGECVARFGTREHDCSIDTRLLSDTTATKTAQEIRQRSQERYGTKEEEIRQLLTRAFSQEQRTHEKEIRDNEGKQAERDVHKETEPPRATSTNPIEDVIHDAKEHHARHYEEREHRSIQRKIKRWGQDMGFVSEVEYELENGKRIDVSLKRPDLMIACEISVTNTTQYEMSNISKCFEAGYDVVCMVSDSKEHLASLEKRAKKEFTRTQFKVLFFLSSSQMEAFMQSTKQQENPPTEVIKGYRIKTEFVDTNQNEAEQFRRDIERILRKKR